MPGLIGQRNHNAYSFYSYAVVRARHVGDVAGNRFPVDSSLLGLGATDLFSMTVIGGWHVGFYGGINYGYGYFGRGFEGGRWDNRYFFYNRSVSNDKLQQKQDQEHVKLDKQKANDAQKQQVEEEHQQQTGQLQQKHQQQQQRLQA